jgi:uncharacterized protein YpmB
MKKHISILIILVSIVSVIFIYYNNDHKECETKTETSYDANGNKTEIKKHICKEKYNL